jgi:hypothetical protein
MDKGTILTEENINIKYDIRFKPLEYNSLVSAIPKNGKRFSRIITMITRRQNQT